MLELLKELENLKINRKVYLECGFEELSIAASEIDNIISKYKKKIKKKGLKMPGYEELSEELSEELRDLDINQYFVSYSLKREEIDGWKFKKI